MPLQRTGLLIIRAWVEKGSRKPVRAHIRATTDVSKGFDGELTVADKASASAKVEAWLDDVEEAAADDDAATSLQEEKKP